MNREPSPISRRHWLFGTLALAVLGADDPSGDPRIAAIRARGRKREMQGFDESASAHYIGIGDANKAFRNEALEVCESVAAEYFKHFSAKGFQLDWPEEKLVVVVLLGPKSYAEYQGAFIDEAIGGHFDLQDNELVMFDFRGRGANPKAPIPEQDNTLALVHETVHQLTFNTGLLELKADIPLCIIEGLATYAETWSPRRKRKIGEKNDRRLLGLTLANKQGVKWVPISRLLAEDKLFDDEKTQQIAYAESWLLVSKLLNSSARLPKFREYLAALREKPDPSRRVEIAAEHLGDLDKLDKEIRPTR
jgi:Protein of unknown function (DUF1570)